MRFYIFMIAVFIVFILLQFFFQLCSENPGHYATWPQMACDL